MGLKYIPGKELNEVLSTSLQGLKAVLKPIDEKEETKESEKATAENIDAEDSDPDVLTF